MVKEDRGRGRKLEKGKIGWEHAGRLLSVGAVTKYVPSEASMCLSVLTCISPTGLAMMPCSSCCTSAVCFTRSRTAPFCKSQVYMKCIPYIVCSNNLMHCMCILY